ncbi:MAG: trypsin-like peptidase domain-containing protein, partial [Lachnospiraceae bacterium]|nr:trypsin-like peptidase domain-containing protein [Lachnospiraceae bacterium]
MIAICCGLCFGIFGGLGFQAVNTATEILKDAVGFEAKSDVEVSKPEETTGEVVAEEVQEDEEIAQVSSADVISATVTDVTEVVQNVMPSVVSINNKYIEKTSFFGQEYSREAEGAGSGIIVGKNETELLLVSNYHVVEAAEELTVQFIDGSQVQAQIKGTDADKDLAVIAVQLEDIEIATMDQIAIAKLGDSTALTVGEPVIAIGNALGYGQSVTTGVVSALNRPIYVEETSMDMYAQEDQEINTFIQTDAAINPGNSGG